MTVPEIDPTSDDGVGSEISALEGELEEHLSEEFS